MNWKQNKTIFNHIIEKDYTIIKDTETNNILYIKWNNFEMKCKYFLVFSVDSDKNIFWSSDNPYVDQKTKYLTNHIKMNMGLTQYKKFDFNIINGIKKQIQLNTHTVYEDEKINFVWCITGQYKNYRQFYIITEIIYL